MADIAAIADSDVKVKGVSNSDLLNKILLDPDLNKEWGAADIVNIDNLFPNKMKEPKFDHERRPWRSIGPDEGIKKIRQMSPVKTEIDALNLYNEICNQEDSEYLTWELSQNSDNYTKNSNP